MAGSATAAATDCALVNPETGTGLTNNVTLTANNGTRTATACAPPNTPANVTVEKADPVIAPVSGNQYTATYAVTVQNTGGSAGTYTLSDTPGFPTTGVTLDSWTVTTATTPTTGTGNPSLPTVDNNTIAQISEANVTIGVGVTHTYSVAITFTTSATATNLTCVTNTVGNGLYNLASIAGSSTATDSGCSSLPGAPSVSVDKSNPAIAPVGSGQYTASYTVTVRNTGTEAGTYTLSDTPGFPAGVTLDSWTVSTSNTPTTGTVNPGLPTVTNNTIAQISATNLSIATGVTHTYTVTITFTAAATVRNLTCVNNTAGNGAYNVASIAGSSIAEDEGCASLPSAPDMVSQIVGLPPAIAPGATVTGTLVCTNQGSGDALTPTCEFSTSTSGVTAVITGACTPALPVASLAATPGSNTISCPVSVTAPANPAAPGNVLTETIALIGGTSATNELVASQSNNGSTASLVIVDAVDDSATVTAAGGSLNVLTNDGIGASAPTLGGSGTATITALAGATAPPGGSILTLDVATGLITVLPDTLPGVYTVPYRLCVAGLTTTCDDAVATITVSAGVADMAASFPTTGAGALPSFIAPGQTYTGLQLTCTSLGPNLALSPTCSVFVDEGAITAFSCTPASPTALAVGQSIDCSFTYTAPGLLGGTDTSPRLVNFTGITSAGNDSDSSNNLVRGLSPSGQVPLVIDAINDSISLPASTGGTVSILVNDQLGTTTNLTVSSTGVTIPVIIVGANTTLPNPSIDANNRLVVPATTPAGTYTVEYRICAQAAPAVCDNAVVTIDIVGAPPPPPPPSEPVVVPTLDARSLLMLVFGLALLVGVTSRRQRGSKPR
ncbi:MAG: hypothetical protein EAZ43_05640 [Betaproteobacteria bacterium]|nr:MAG: hypothetical protein EAZ43_05640 [Betaproteobacteria bacterium]